MRRLAVVALSACSLAIVGLGLAPGAASAAFTQCPAVGNDTSCQYLITVGETENSVEADPAQGPYDGVEDSLIGVQNNSGKPLSSLPISAESNLFGFENDGICSPDTSGGSTGPAAPGCVLLAFNSGELPNAKHGEPCPSGGDTECGFEDGEQPAGNKFPEGISVNGFDAKKNPVSGYEGPTSYFTNIAAFGIFGFGSGVVNFAPAIPPGGSSYFSLELPPTSGFGNKTELTTTLSGEGKSGASISVLAGSAVTDAATLTGENAASGTGKVTFRVYSDPGCTQLVAEAGVVKMAGGVAKPSGAEALPAGRYYWQASYGGDLSHQSALSACGSEILNVLTPTSTSTVQSGAGVKFSSIAVPVGASVTDSALISGANAATATGTVTYALFKNSKCALPAVATSSAAVSGGIAGPSAPAKPAAGRYWWIASYSGDEKNAPSASPCGGEVLIVGKKLTLGLKLVKGCVSKRHFRIHPGRKGKFEEFINGKLERSGRIGSNGASVDLRGLPKGAYVVQLVVTDSKGHSFFETHTFHTCIAGKHKHKGKKH
jgi:hypothetical protein